MTTTDPLTFIYNDPRPIDALGARYAPEGQFSYGKDVVIARLPKQPEDGDGQPVVLTECRMPARCFTLRALPSTNSVGEPVEGFCLSSGSGEGIADLLVRLADEITEGTIALQNIGT